MQRIIPILILAAAPLIGQYVPQRTTTRTRNPNTIGDTGAYHNPAATMHGTLKHMNGKVITIIGDGDQTVEIVRTHKTKFLRNGKEIKPTEIAVGSILSIDVGLFPDLSPQAINVMVDSPPIEGATPPPAKSGHSTGEMDREEPVTAEPESKPPAATPAKPPSP
jgi:hypothetical protein